MQRYRYETDPTAKRIAELARKGWTLLEAVPVAPFASVSEHCFVSVPR
jgi:hypothetical protein